MRNLLPFLLLACKGPTETPTDTGATPTDVPTPDGLCAELEASEGAVYCREAIRNDDRFDELDSDGVLWLLPITGTLPAVAINANQTDLLGFLQLAAAEFADLDAAGLEELTHGPDRAYATGRLHRRTERVVFSFADDEATYDDVKDAKNDLEDLVHEDSRFGLDLMFAPSAVQADVVGGWRPNFDVEGLDLDPDYVPYIEADAIGTVRVLDRLAYENGVMAASWGPEDILVLDDAEGDTERVVAGVVSSEPLPRFGRLVQRSRQRGTAACYQRDAYTTLAAHDGELVRLTCGPSSIAVSSATEAEAAAFRSGLVGSPVGTEVPDLAAVDLMPLLDLDPNAPMAGGTYGLEATRLAEVWQAIPGNLQLRGLAVPASYYQDFLERNTWIVDLGAGPAPATYQQTLDAWLVDTAFLGNASLRRDRLEALSGVMRTAEVDPLLVDRLNTSLPLVFGSSLTGLRFRASANLAEQAVLPYADLYDAASGCVADDLDADIFGPSACDAASVDELSALAAISEVYASLWTFAAFEQRSFYGVDSNGVFMSLLVTDRVAGELADVVVEAPSGAGVLVAAQQGSGSAVGRANSYPELSEVSEATIVRLQGSSEVSRGEQVLDDTQLRALEHGVDRVADVIGGTVFTEWKLLSNGQWALKHAQPVDVP